MLISRRIASQLRRNPPQHTFPPVAAEDGIIFLEDTERRSYYGSCFVGHSMTGINENVFLQLKSAISANYPPDTFIQISQLSVPDIDYFAEAWLAPKLEACATSTQMAATQREALREICLEKARFFLEGKTEPHIRSTGMRLHRVIQVASIKVPVSSQPTDEDLTRSKDLIEKFEQSIQTAGLAVARSDAGKYLGTLRLFFDPFQTEATWYDDLRELRQQVLKPGFDLDYEDTNVLKLDDVYARILSTKKFPPKMHIGIVDMLQGEPAGINNQIPIPWAMTLSLRLPDRRKKKKWFDRRYQTLTFQASQGNITKWVPRLATKKENADLLKSDLDNGEAPCEKCFTMTLYSKDPKELNRVTSQVTTYAAGLQWELVEDKGILWPLFWNQLPLFPSDTSIQFLERYWSMSVRQALAVTPCLTEWTGNSVGSTLLYETRRGLPFCFDLYETSSNQNAMVFAQSRSGKTFLVQDKLTAYLAEGARAWVVDIGRGYYKQCKAYGGEFWSFSEDSKICLNPFTNVIDLLDEMDLLVTLLTKMAAPTDGLDDYAKACLQEAIKAEFSTRGNSTTITNIAEWLGKQDKPEMHRLSKMLFPFTMYGQHGHWFEGDNNLNFKSNFIVLELEELNQKPTLQQVVLMILMSKIQHDMFQTMDGIKKLAVFDESWALFKDPEVARFLNHAYRRFARYRGSAIVIFQDIADVYSNPELVAVAANANTKIILYQLPESIDRAVASGHLALDSYGVSQLKTVHTVDGAYSEAMFLQGTAWSIARIVAPRFLQVLYSSKGDARDLVIKAVEEGVPVHEAVNRFIAERG